MTKAKEVHLWANQCQITHDEVRIGLLILHDGGLGYFEWINVGRDKRGRRIWQNVWFPGFWDWYEQHQKMKAKLC